MCKACPENVGVSDDFETGEAVCWMFSEAKEPFWSDEKYEENRNKNKQLAIKTLEYMFEKNEVWDEFEEGTWYKLDDYYDDKEIEELKELLSKLKQN